jgi:multiple antibiotic resistance protein
MLGILEISVITFMALLPISNPFGAVPLFLSLTKGHSKEWAKKQAF